MRMQEDLNVEIAGQIAEREGHQRAWWGPQVGLGGDRRELFVRIRRPRIGIKEEGDGW
jgi:hypothetical protein